MSIIITDQINLINYDNYKLDIKSTNKLAFELHKNLRVPSFVDNILEKFGLDLLIKTRNSGLISNIIYYFIETENTQMINKLISKLDTISNFKLMKRDYMGLINYFYQSDYVRTEMYFVKHILDVKSDLNTSILQLTDINFILKNKLHKLLPYLSGLFITTDLDYSNCVVPGPVLTDTQLKKFSIKPELQIYLLEQIQNHMGHYINITNNFYVKNTGKFSAIIDAGNVLYAHNGKITIESINDLAKIIEKTRETIGEPIIIIHKRHFKLNPRLVELFIKTNTIYFQTPYNFNDDIFIMWFFVKSSCLINIVSNDKYRDHIFNYQSSKKVKVKTDDFSMCEFSNVLTEQTLSYQLNPLEIQKVLPYSRCIQLVNNFVYIPHISKGFIKIQVNL